MDARFPRYARSAPLQRALWMLGVLSVLLGAAQLALASNAPELAAENVAFSVVFAVWATAGLVAWWRRPRTSIGPLLYVGAVCLLLGGLGNTEVEAFVVVGTVFATSILAITVHLLHAFPSGRLRGGLSIGTVIAAYVIVLLPGPQALLAAAGQPQWASALLTTQAVCGSTIMALTTVVLIRRLVRATPTRRRVLLPLYSYSAATIVAIGVTPSIVRAIGGTRQLSGFIQLALLAGVALAFLSGVLVGAYSRTAELEALSSWLGTAGTARPVVARSLAETLGDESLQIVYWLPEREVFVDERGREVDRDADPGRGWVDVTVADRLAGAITYDTALVADDETVHRAASILAIAIDRERLTSALLGSNRALLESRQRIVETADRERERIARDLHDGLQVQLVLLALEAQQLADAPDASPETAEAGSVLRQRIDAAAADLRRLVHNVVPAALVEQGLSAATEDLVDRLALPATLDSRIEDDALAAATTQTAYLVVAEALTNAVKHSSATAVHVLLDRAGDVAVVEVSDNGSGGASLAGGTGLRGLVDRVDVIGGRLTLVSAPGRGTRVRAELPCG